MESGKIVHKNMHDLQKALERLENDTLVSSENRQIIARFANARMASGLTRIRIVKLIYTLRFLSHWLKKPFDQANKDDLVGLTGSIEQQAYSEYTNTTSKRF